MSPEQPLKCHATSAVVHVRLEGIAELLGDIILTFSGGTPANARETLTLNIMVTFNVNVTNPGIDGQTTDALLVMEEGASSGWQAIAGRREGQASVIFENVRLSPPGPVGERRIRLTNLRGNISQLVMPLASGEFPDPEVRVYITVTGTAPVTVSNNLLPVALPLLGLTTMIRGGEFMDVGLPHRFLRPEEVNEDLIRDPRNVDAVTSLTIRFGEAYAHAFKTRSEEGSSATNGTRFIVRFFNVPDHVRLFVTTRDAVYPVAQRSSLAAAKALLVSGPDFRGAGGKVPEDVPLGSGGRTTGVPITELPVHGGVAFAVWEWVRSGSRPAVVEQVYFGAVLALEPDQSAAGIVLASFCFAPMSRVTTASPSEPAPRFIDTGISRSAFDVARKAE